MRADAAAGRATTTTTIRQPGEPLALPCQLTKPAAVDGLWSIRPSGVLIRLTDGRTASAERQDCTLNFVAYKKLKVQKDMEHIFLDKLSSIYYFQEADGARLNAIENIMSFIFA